MNYVKTTANHTMTAAKTWIQAKNLEPEVRPEFA